ncbi:MAG: preprotein translocase subunit SecE [Bacillota bacterium]|jgi:preprotein translocase subunit SecE|nr:preprotein translocase subunit SecE [Bacillota bacterium]NLV62947.1 preprotein translocase subunit SecE [Clostridiaceae bacterium]
MAEQSKKPNIFQRLARFTKEVRSELKKVIWPSKNQVINNTIIVLITCLILGGIIWILDFILGQVYTLVFV